MDNVWYYAAGNKTVGPVSLASLTTILSLVSNPKEVRVWREGFANWERADNVHELAAIVIRPPPIEVPTNQKRRNQENTPPNTNAEVLNSNSEPPLVVAPENVRQIVNPNDLIYKATIANWLLIIFWAVFMSAELSQVYLLDQMHSLIIEYGFGRVPSALIPTWGDASDLTVRVTSIGWYFGLLACTMYCFSQLKSILEVHFREKMQYSMGWTIGSLFIPIVFLYRPWVGLGEIRRKIFAKRFKSSKDFDIFTLLFGVVFFLSLLSMRVASSEMDKLVKKNDAAASLGFYAEAIDMTLIYAALVTAITFVAFAYCRSSIISIQKAI